MSRPQADAPDLDAVPVAKLLVELARRYRVRFGQIAITYHDGRPSPRLAVEHRIQHTLDPDAQTAPPSPPEQRRGKP